MGLDCQSRKEQQNTRPIAQNYITAYSQGYYPAFKKKTNSNVERSEAFQLSNVIKSSLFRLFRLSCQTRFPIPVSQSSRSLSTHTKGVVVFLAGKMTHFYVLFVGCLFIRGRKRKRGERERESGLIAETD